MRNINEEEENVRRRKRIGDEEREGRRSTSSGSPSTAKLMAREGQKPVKKAFALEENNNKIERTILLVKWRRKYGRVRKWTLIECDQCSRYTHRPLWRSAGHRATQMGIESQNKEKVYKSYKRKNGRGGKYDEAEAVHIEVSEHSANLGVVLHSLWCQLAAVRLPLKK